MWQEGWADSGGSDDLITHPFVAHAAALCVLQEGLVSRQVCLEKKRVVVVCVSFPLVSRA